MKSLQVANCGFSNESYSDLQVLHSGAGYYIGTVYTDPETRFQEPGSRDSCYFKDAKTAGLALAKLEELAGKPELSEDEAFISVWETWLTKEGLDPNGVGYRMEP